MTLKDILSKEKASSFNLEKGKIVSVKSTDLIPHVFEVLIKEGILSAPVVDANTGKYVSFVDIMDLLAVVVECFEKEELESKGIEGILDQHLRFVEHNASEIGNLSKVDKFIHLGTDASLWDVCKKMVEEKVHRVAILDDGGRIVSLITQSAIIQYFNKHIKELGNVATKKCSEIEGWKGEVLTVDENTRAIDAFLLMSTMRMSGVAIVDEEQNFVGALSARDIKIIGPYAEYFRKLYLDVMSYITEIRMKNLKAVFPAISGKENDSFGHIIQKLAATRIHRLFMVDDKHHLIGIFSLGDVIKVIVQEA